MGWGAPVTRDAGSACCFLAIAAVRVQIAREDWSPDLGRAIALAMVDWGKACPAKVGSAAIRLEAPWAMARMSVTLTVREVKVCMSCIDDDTSIEKREPFRTNVVECE